MEIVVFVLACVGAATVCIGTFNFGYDCFTAWARDREAKRVRQEKDRKEELERACYEANIRARLEEARNRSRLEQIEKSFPYAGPPQFRQQLINAPLVLGSQCVPVQQQPMPTVDIYTRLSDADKRVDRLSKEINKIKNAPRSVPWEAREALQRTGDHAKQLEAMSQRGKDTARSLTQLEQRTSDYVKEFTDLRSRANNAGYRLASLEATLRSVGELRNIVAGLESRHDETECRVKQLETEAMNNMTTVSKLTKRVSQLWAAKAPRGRKPAKKAGA